MHSDRPDAAKKLRVCVVCLLCSHAVSEGTRVQSDTACTKCRASKVRCGGEFPCARCVKLGGEACIYVPLSKQPVMKPKKLSPEVLSPAMLFYNFLTCFVQTIRFWCWPCADRMAAPGFLGAVCEFKCIYEFLGESTCEQTGLALEIDNGSGVTTPPWFIVACRAQPIVCNQRFHLFSLRFYQFS
jgi:hypothetical protein